MRVRRARALVAYWSPTGFALENYRTSRIFEMDAAAMQILDALSEWTDLDDVAQLFPDLDEDSITQAVSELCACGLLLCDSRPSEVEADARIGDAWPKWGQAARHLHFTSRNTPFNPFEAETLEFRAGVVDGRPPPALTKTYPDVPRLPLPRHPPPVTPAFFDVLHGRRTCRSFTDQPVSLTTFATLLATVYGPVAFLDADVFGTVMQRTSPCGGSRHEIEAYVITRRVEHVPPGVYHYQPVEHALEQIAPEPDWAELTDIAVNQSGIAEAAFVVVLTAVLERIQFKYLHTGAYRVMLLNAGHLNQTFALTATALGLAPFQTGAFADERLEGVLGIDGVDETVLFLSSAGHRTPRPADVPADDRRFPPPPPPRQVRLH